ncbi:putative integral membrane protein [Microbacterium esteraromaticum]|uniref:Putative integral membrane protein n=1 Tax=Microbacterium esteraromaticum TaxID=57043 RepID=A0A1R4K4S0_9MICO|nr:phage holin family protein [Microbacterium esteraromaticum]SJN39360.1 putative integral membrane protein [Microbacterium esteraromaticum]
MPRGYRDRADDSLLTLLGDLPELVRNLVTAEINAAKAWVSRTAKDAGIGSVWFVLALFFLFWMIPALLAFTIIGLASWWPAWLAALATVGILLLIIAIFALLGVMRFRRLSKRENPGQAVATDVRLVKEAGDDQL